MYVIDQNNIGKMYYLYTDHQGSPNLITDAQCNVVEELSFDAWGNRRDPSSWQPYNSTATVPESFIDRGFTFHACPERPVLSEAEASRREHLYPLTLINMNGRAYDPLVGRFLSPDPYIQAPDNTQNLNRYSYCLNNPLKYTDPSGEFLFAPALAMATAAEYFSNLATGKGSDIVKSFRTALEITNGASNCARFNISVSNNSSISFGLDPFSFGVSAGYHNENFNAVAGYGMLNAYCSVNVTVPIGDFSITPGIGYSSGYGSIFGKTPTKVSGYQYYGGISYYDRANNQTFSAGFTSFTGSHPQNNWFVGYQKGDFSFKMTNDAWAGGDKFRTAAAEIGFGDASFGFNLFTTAPPVDEWKKQIGGLKEFISMWGKNNAGTYSKGDRVWAGLYVGYRSGNTSSRIGVDAPWVQDFFQNGLHMLNILGFRPIASPCFNTNYGSPTRPFLQGGYINPFSLYPF